MAIQDGWTVSGAEDERSGSPCTITASVACAKVLLTTAIATRTLTSGKDSSDARTVMVKCPTGGYDVIGGSGQIVGGDGKPVLRMSRPVDTRGWEAEAAETDLTDARWELRVTADCARLPTRARYEILESESRSDSTTRTTLKRSCRQASVATGGGGDVEDAPEGVGLTQSEPRSQDDGTASWETAATERDPTSVAWRLHAYVICTNTITRFG